MKLNFYYVCIPFTNTRKLFKYETQITKYINDILNEIFSNSNQPYVVIVRKDTKEETYFKAI